MYELSKLTQKRDLFLKYSNHNREKTAMIANKGKLVAKTSSKYQPSIVNTTLIGKKSTIINPPFLINFKIFKMNVHIYSVDSRTSSNVISYFVCKNLSVKPKKTSI